MTVRVDVPTPRMFADSEDELHAMALRVGASMTQFSEDGRPYYTLTSSQIDAVLLHAAGYNGD